MDDVTERFKVASPEERRRAVTLFKVLSHPERLRLVCHLGDGHVTTQKELVEELDWPQSTAARHVAALRDAGLVAAERDGTEIRLTMATPVALRLLETVCDWVRQDDGTPPPSVDSSS
jgi:ArsR family transcriptional regulator